MYTRGADNDFGQLRSDQSQKLQTIDTVVSGRPIFSQTCHLWAIAVENMEGEYLDDETDAFATETLAQLMSPQLFHSQPQA